MKSCNVHGDEVTTSTVMLAMCNNQQDEMFTTMLQPKKNIYIKIM